MLFRKLSSPDFSSQEKFLIEKTRHALLQRERDHGALRERIAAGTADPISEREREQLRQIALGYIRRFGKRSFIREFGEAEYKRVVSESDNRKSV